jgi:20S proteasome alpha/beta subunit
MNDDAQRITRKEAARLARKAVYKAAKERRKSDPRFLAFQAAQKVRRKAMNELQKERRRTAKQTRDDEAAARRESERVAKARALLRLVS